MRRSFGMTGGDRADSTALRLILRLGSDDERFHARRLISQPQYGRAVRNMPHLSKVISGDMAEIAATAFVERGSVMQADYLRAGYLPSIVLILAPKMEGYSGPEPSARFA